MNEKSLTPAKGPGFAVLYRWRLKPGTEDQFINAWSKVSEELREKHGSLGSRLHRGKDNIWYSYAQWPSEKHRQCAFQAPTSVPEAVIAMKACIEEHFPEVVLDAMADFLVPI